LPFSLIWVLIGSGYPCLMGYLGKEPFAEHFEFFAGILSFLIFPYIFVGLRIADGHLSNYVDSTMLRVAIYVLSSAFLSLPVFFAMMFGVGLFDPFLKLAQSNS